MDAGRDLFDYLQLGLLAATAVGALVAAVAGAISAHRAGSSAQSASDAAMAAVDAVSLQQQRADDERSQERDRELAAMAAVRQLLAAARQGLEEGGLGAFHTQVIAPDLSLFAGHMGTLLSGLGLQRFVALINVFNTLRVLTDMVAAARDAGIAVPDEVGPATQSSLDLLGKVLTGITEAIEERSGRA